MSYGGAEGGRQRRELNGKRKLFSGNDFAYAVARIAVTQLCESVELNVYQGSQTREGVRFSSFQQSALERLTDVAVQYIQSIGKTAHLYANLAGRVEGNSLDVVQALEDLGSGLGFAGASVTDRCLADSGVVKDIVHYTQEADEMPFVYSLPRFLIYKEKIRTPSFSEVGTEHPDEHIPVWLPAFPETKLCNRSADTDVGTVKAEVPSKENGSSLMSTQHPFNGGRLEVLKSPKDVPKSTDGEEEVEGNPLNNALIQFVDKEVLHVFRPLELSNVIVGINHVPDKHISNNHHIPAVEVFVPSDETNKMNRVTESKVEEKKGGARPQQALVRFKIGTLKRPSCLAINQSVHK